MHITSKGQVTIPEEIRHRFGLLPHTEVNFVVKGKHVYLEKAPRKLTRGQRIVQHMRGHGTIKMTIDEIMALTRGEDK